MGDSRRADERALVRYPELQVLYDAWTLAPLPLDLEGPTVSAASVLRACCSATARARTC